MSNGHDQAIDDADLAPGDEHVAGGVGPRVLSYLTGLGLAILLTATSFFVAGTNLVWEPSIPVALVVLAIATGFLVTCFRRLPLQYGAYAGAVLLMCVSSPVIGQPLLSFDRYVLTIFPLWMAAGAWIARRRLERVAVAVGSILLVFYTFYFARGSFIA